MFYERIKQLCEKNKTSVYKVAVEIGYSRSAVGRWKSGSIPGGATINKIADYFGVSVEYLLGETDELPEKEEKKELSREELKEALFGSGSEVTDEMLNEVLSFAQFVKHREKKQL